MFRGYIFIVSSQDDAVHYWTVKGADRSKLVLGIPAYGTSFTVVDVATANTIGGYTKGPGNAGTFSNHAGKLAYYEVQY